MNKSNIVLMLAMLISGDLHAVELALVNGTAVLKDNLAKLAATSVPYAVALNSIEESDDAGILGFMVAGDKKLYALSGSMKLHITDIKTENHVANWPLDVNKETTITAGEIPQGAAQLEEDGVYHNTYNSLYWTAVNPSEAKTGPKVIFDGQHTDTLRALGCLDAYPLRFGDIDGDSEPELVVTRQSNLYISSVNTQSVIFHGSLFLDDDAFIGGDPRKERTPLPDFKTAPPAQPQFHSMTSGRKYLEGKTFPAWRSFAKFFFDDFDGDKKPDIVMWRKLYESRLNKDPVIGFAKKGELWVHYSFVDGQYKKQPTDIGIIKKWLSDKQLTWQKGYPSKSECKGQEGKLIPEIHDDLLNDPDVLK